MESRTDTPARARRKRHIQPVEQPTDANLKLCSCVIPASTPHFKSFAHIRNPKVRRAKDFEQHLLCMRDSFPEYKTLIDEQIVWARSQQERGRESDRDRVLKQLKDCPLTCAEVAEDLNMPKATAYKILQEFAGHGLVIITHRPRRDGKKPLCVYSLFSSPTRTI